MEKQWKKTWEPFIVSDSGSVTTVINPRSRKKKNEVAAFPAILPGAMSEPPNTPLNEAQLALEDFTGEERDVFFSSLDKLGDLGPVFDTPAAPTPTEGDRYEIEEEDWTWLATQVGTRTTQDLATFAKSEYDRMALEDPDLVRPHAAPQPRVTRLRVGALPYPRTGSFAPPAPTCRATCMEPRTGARSPNTLGRRLPRAHHARLPSSAVPAAFSAGSQM